MHEQKELNPRCAAKEKADSPMSCSNEAQKFILSNKDSETDLAENSTKISNSRKERKLSRKSEVDRLFVENRAIPWHKEVMLVENFEETERGKHFTRGTVEARKTKIIQNVIAKRKLVSKKSSTSKKGTAFSVDHVQAHENATEEFIGGEHGTDIKMKHGASRLLHLTDHQLNCMGIYDKFLHVTCNIEEKGTLQSFENEEKILEEQTQKSLHLVKDIKDNTASNEEMNINVDSVTTARNLSECDCNLPFPISFNIDLNVEFKNKMKLFQQERGCQIDQKAFERACVEGDVETVRMAVCALKNKQSFPDYDLNPNSTDSHQFSIVMRLCEKQCGTGHEHEDVMEYLVQAGANINLVHPDTGHTAMHLAVIANAHCKVKKLINLRSVVNVPDGSRLTPLIIAAKYNRHHIASILLECCANFNYTNIIDSKGNNETALQIASNLRNKLTADIIRNHSDRVRVAYNTARARVLIDIAIKRDVSPLHIYGLWEAPEITICFPYEVCHLPNSRYGYVLLLGVGHISAHQMHVRIWGPCPFVNVRMNGASTIRLQEQSNFIYLVQPISGINRLSIGVDQRAHDSRMCLLAQVFLVQLKQPPLPKFPSMLLEAAGNI